MTVKSESEVTQSCPTLRDPMDCSLPGSSIHGIFQANVLEWGAIAFYSNQNSMVLAQKHTHRLTEQNRQPMNLSKLWETVKDRGGWHAARVGRDLAIEHIHTHRAHK